MHGVNEGWEKRKTVNPEVREMYILLLILNMIFYDG